MAHNDNIIEITDNNFTDEVEAADGLHMVDFWAEWCGPCRMIAPVVEQIADDYAGKGLRVGKLDVDSNQRTASRFNVLSIPSILFFKGGECVDRVVGLVPRKQLEEKIDRHL